MTDAIEEEGSGSAAERIVDGLEAVIFDFDGVLVDTEPWWHEVRQRWAADRGLAWTEDGSLACRSLNSREWSTVMRDRSGVPDLPEEIERAVVDGLVARYGAEVIPVVPGAPAATARIASRLPVAIASSSHPAALRAALLATGLAPLFRIVVSSDEVARGKPAPDVYLEAARRLRADPARCLVVEDSANGVLAGRAAGMRVVLVPNASVPPSPGAADAADLVVARLGDLPIARPGAIP